VDTPKGLVIVESYNLRRCEMQERKVNRKYDKQFKEEAVKQFKEEAVRLATEEGRKVAEVARSLGIHENLLRTWRRKYQEDSAGSFPGTGHLKPQDEEFRKLQKENANLEGG